MFNERAAVSRYNNTWDVDIVLQYLKTLHPVGDLSLKLLTLKLNALPALLSAQRVQTLVSLSTASVAILPDRVKFTVTSQLKTSRPTKGPVVIQVLRFTESELLCPYCVLLEYLNRTRAVRESTGVSNLLLSYVKPFKPISTDTCARWLKMVLASSGIDTNTFTAHSYRGATTSKAIVHGVSLDVILKTANWSSESTFRRFYRKDILTGSDLFPSVILTDS